MATAEIELEWCGREHTFTVEFEITNPGSSDSYSPIYGATGGDPIEWDIESITDDDGSDVTKLLETIPYGTNLFEVREVDPNWQDSIRKVLFGGRTLSFIDGSNPREYYSTLVGYRTRFKPQQTYYGKIEEELLGTTAFNEAVGDYGSDCWDD